MSGREVTEGEGTMQRVMTASLLEARPKYRVLQDIIRAGIADGTLTDAAGKLPSEQDMARSFGVAYMTVRTAVNEMVAEGLLQRIHGKGTFVRKDPPPVPATARGVLGLVVPSLASLWNVAGLYYFPGIVQGFCAEATRLGYEPSVIGRSQDALASRSGELSDVAGVACLLTSREDASAVDALRDLRRVPLVTINRYKGRRAVSSVAADQAGGMETAVQMLIARGHTRIAFLPGPAENLGAEERLAGFQRAVAAAGLRSAEVITEAPTDYTDLSGVLRTRWLLERVGRQRPTAIVTAGDLIAAGVMQAAQESGLSVPDDLSVVGYGDFEVAVHTRPALTTVRLPLAELGARAAELLHEGIQGGTRRGGDVLPAKLVERDSVAAPRS